MLADCALDRRRVNSVRTESDYGTTLVPPAVTVGLCTRIPTVATDEVEL
jgi:hypothetical protein